MFIKKNLQENKGRDSTFTRCDNRQTRLGPPDPGTALPPPVLHETAAAPRIPCSARRMDVRVSPRTKLSLYPNPTFPFCHSAPPPCRTPRRRRLPIRASATRSDEVATAAASSEVFDWYSHWYPVAPVCDLDKRRPHARKVMGLDVVVWWDRNQGRWRVFDDSCPHRLAPLSEGRIDQWGRLQCVYHGWCFDGEGRCKFIPQEPIDGPKFHTFPKACAASYPSVEQNKIVWFWPSTDSKYKNISEQKKPPYIPELDDSSYSSLLGNREIPFGYEVLIENCMDVAHFPYAHHGILRIPQDKSKFRDREGGRPMDMKVLKLDKGGFFARNQFGFGKFIAPCIYYSYSDPRANNKINMVEDVEEDLPAATKKLPRFVFVFICIPVSSGRSRIIWSFPRNVAVWIDKIIPRWLFHVNQNLVLDSDMSLLHVEDKKIAEVGPKNWMKSCFVPTSSDAIVVGFRRWLEKYSNGRVEWGSELHPCLPSIPPREQLMDRYWSHVVQCTSCSRALKAMKALDVALQVTSLVSIGIVAVVKQNTLSLMRRSLVVSFALLCFLASRWLSHFIYKNFYYHDYDHAFK